MQALAASPILSSILKGKASSADMSTQTPAVARELEELLVWQDFYQLQGYATAAIKSAFSRAIVLFRPHYVKPAPHTMRQVNHMRVCTDYKMR